MVLFVGIFHTSLSEELIIQAGGQFTPLDLLTCGIYPSVLQLKLNWVIRYYIILIGSARTPKCITSVDVMPNNNYIITFEMLMVCSNCCRFTFENYLN